jgi:hypothetical protein
MASAGLLVVTTLAGCGLTPARDESLRLAESPLEIRNLQSRAFTAPSEQALLAATVAVLQDMEYNLDGIEAPLGVLSASKVADGALPGEKAALFMADLLCALMAGDCSAMSTATDDQLILLTLVVQPSVANPNEYVARITLQRVIYDVAERVKHTEPIHEAEFYQQIFARLSKSLFLEVEG